MAGFWEHYAQANDDIRTQLVDRGWFQQRFPSQGGMESDVRTMSQQSDTEMQEFYGGVSYQDSQAPDGLHQVGFNDGIEQNPDTTRDAVQEFYGVGERPSGTELGGDAQSDLDLWQQHERVGEMRDLYGEDVKQSDVGDFYGHSEEPDVAQEHNLYGYDALDDGEEPELTQRM